MSTTKESGSSNSGAELDEGRKSSLPKNGDSKTEASDRDRENQAGTEMVDSEKFKRDP